MNEPKYLIIHHTGGSDAFPLLDTSNQSFEDVNAYHRTAPNVWLGYYSSLGYAIGYHYFIDKKGKLTQGRLDTDEGAHTIGYNKQSLGICLAGNFDTTMPTKEQIEALKTLLSMKKAQYGISIDNIVPHRKFAQKTCYGRLLGDSWVLDILTPPSNTQLSTCLVENTELKKKVEWYNSIWSQFKLLLNKITL